ncbi:uncharacterized protein LOC123523254 isoform X2 [Mercenaria mercenaria]|nr:uncharacterized protein LOC123523254 isoform X2 [Mercenaria mercenaria]
MKESKEQEATLSPKKKNLKAKNETKEDSISKETSKEKKKNSPTKTQTEERTGLSPKKKKLKAKNCQNETEETSEKKNENIQNKTQAGSKGKCVYGTALQIGRSMISLMDQFLDESPPASTSGEQSNSVEAKSETDCISKTKANQNQILDNGGSDGENTGSSTVPPVLQNSVPANSFQSDDLHVPPMSLTNTWQTCQNAMAAVSSETSHSPNRQIPMPSAEVLQTLRAVCQPDFIAFISYLTEHLQQPSNCNHPCFQPQVNMPQPQPSFYMDLMNSDIENSLCSYQSVPEDLSTMDVPLETSTPAKTACTTSMTSSNVELRRSPRKQIQKSHEKIVKNATTPSSGSPGPSHVAPKKQSDDMIVMSATTPSSGSQGPSDDTPKKQSDDMVKLLDSSSILVSRNAKRKILAAAKKKNGKEGYIAMYKLCGEIFSSKEMAESRGLGIGKSSKAVDERPPLNPHKIKDLKDFVTAWCKANKLPEPTDSQLNSACTERIGYARKQEKKIQQ